MLVLLLAAAKQFAMGLEREHQAQAIDQDKQHRQGDAQGAHERDIHYSVVGFGDYGWNQYRDYCEEEEAGLKARAISIIFLKVIFEAAYQEGRA